MPIERIPVYHRFGIIAQSHRQELQRRIDQTNQIGNEQQLLDTGNARLSFPSQINESFILKFQDETLTENQRCELCLQAEVVIEKCRRKCGLKTFGVGAHVNLEAGWHDLRFMSLCNDHSIQQASLLVLSSSLEIVPLSIQNLPSLVAMATDIIQWISEFAIKRPCLRENECIVIEIAEKLFQRILCHSLLFNSEFSEEFIEQLQKEHDLYPHLLFVYENHPLLMHQLSKVHFTILNLLQSNSRITILDGKTSEQFVTEGLANIDNIDNMKEMTHLFRDAKISTHSQSLSIDWHGMRFHDLSPTLWHALDIWKSCHDPQASVECSVMEFLRCCTNFRSEERSLQILGLEVIFEASKSNLTVLKFIQRFIYDHLRGAITADQSKQNDTKRQSTGEKDVRKSVKSEATNSTILPGNNSSDDSTSLNGWSWLLIATCVRCLALVFKWGITSVIQQEALMGEKEKRVGLLNMLHFQLPPSKLGIDEDDWSWLIRHLATHETERSIQLFTDDNMKDGLRNISWSALAKQQSHERDARVLEAYQVAIVTSANQSTNDKLIFRMCEIITENSKGKERILKMATFDTTSHQCSIETKVKPTNNSKRNREKEKGNSDKRNKGTKGVKQNNISGWDKMQELAKEHWLEDQIDW